MESGHRAWSYSGFPPVERQFPFHCCSLGGQVLGLLLTVTGCGWCNVSIKNLHELTDLSPLLCPQVFGGLVWILVASTHIYPGNPLGWVMFVSIFCFVMTTLFFFFFLLGHNQRKIWNSLVRPSRASLTFNARVSEHVGSLSRDLVCLLRPWRLGRGEKLWELELLLVSGC